MTQPEPQHSPLKIVEIDEEGWAAFKKLEGEQRREYSKSPDAVRDHEAWLYAPMAADDEWGSVSEATEEDWVEPVIVPNPDQIPWDDLYDWSLENTIDETTKNSPESEL